MRASGEHAHGRYRMLTFASGGKVRARAFLLDSPVRDADGAFIDTEAASAEAALAAMRARLDRLDTDQQAAWRDGTPTAEQYAMAFTAVGPKIAKYHWDMLDALLHAENRTLTAAEIAAAAGYKSHSSVNEKLGRLGHMIADALNYRPPPASNDEIYWTATLAVPVEHGEQRFWTWTLRPEVAAYLLTRQTAPA